MSGTEEETTEQVLILHAGVKAQSICYALKETLPRKLILSRFQLTPKPNRTINFTAFGAACNILEEEIRVLPIPATSPLLPLDVESSRNSLHALC